MPIRPPIRCDYPACADIAIVGSSYCEKHQKKTADHDREKYHLRYKNSPWRKLYDTKGWYAGCEPACLIRDPLCKLQITPLCKQHGGDGSVVADHIIDHRGNPQLFYDMNNLQGACRACHDAKPKPQNGRMPQNDLAPTGSDGGKIFISCLNSKAVEQALHADDDILGDVDEIKIPYDGGWRKR